MITQVVIEDRKYKADVSPDEQQGAMIIIGPPEGLVDALGLPEPFASKLHNALYNRGVFTAQDAQRKPKDVTGALQEALSIDAQRLVEEFFKLNKETVL